MQDNYIIHPLRPAQSDGSRRFLAYRRLGLRWDFLGEFTTPDGVADCDLWRVVRATHINRPIYVLNIWVGHLIGIAPAEVTQAEADAYASLIDADVLDALSGMDWESPGEWLAAYVDIVGPEVAGRVVCG